MVLDYFLNPTAGCNEDQQLPAAGPQRGTATQGIDTPLGHEGEVIKAYISDLQHMSAGKLEKVLRQMEKELNRYLEEKYLRSEQK